MFRAVACAGRQRGVERGVRGGGREFIEGGQGRRISRSGIRARFNAPVQNYAPFAYDAVYVIVDAMKRANSVEAPKVLAAIASTDFNGVTGHIAFDDKGDLKGGAFTLVGFKDNKKTVIDVVTP